MDIVDILRRGFDMSDEEYEELKYYIRDTIDANLSLYDSISLLEDVLLQIRREERFKKLLN